MKNTNGIKLIWVVVIAVVALVVGFLVRGVIGGQAASVFRGTTGLTTIKTTTPVVKDPSRLVHLYWGNGVCNLERWNPENNTWTPLGSINGVKEKNCHDIPPAPTNNPQQTYGVTGATNSLNVKDDTLTPARVIDMSWVVGKGCEVRQYNGSTHIWDVLGYASGVNQADCHVLRPANTGTKTPISKTPVDSGTSTTTQVKSTR